MDITMDTVETVSEPKIYEIDEWLDFMNKNPSIFNKPNFVTDLSKNPNITIDIVKKYLNVKNSNIAWDFNILSSHPNITWDDVKNNPGMSWNYDNLSKNPNINWDILKDNPDKPWNYQIFSISHTVPIKDIQNNPKTWCYTHLLENKNYTETELDDIRKIYSKEIQKNKDSAEKLEKQKNSKKSPIFVKNRNIPKEERTKEEKEIILKNFDDFAKIYKTPNTYQYLYQYVYKYLYIYSINILYIGFCIPVYFINGGKVSEFGNAIMNSRRPIRKVHNTFTYINPYDAWRQRLTKYFDKKLYTNISRKAFNNYFIYKLYGGICHLSNFVYLTIWFLLFFTILFVEILEVLLNLRKNDLSFFIEYCCGDILTCNYILENPNLLWDYVYLYKTLPITPEFIENSPDFNYKFEILSENPNLTWDIIQQFPNKAWDFKHIGLNKNITWDIIQNNSNKKWSYSTLHKNPNITEEILLQNFDKNWDFLDILESYDLTNCSLPFLELIIVKNFDKSSYGCAFKYDYLEKINSNRYLTWEFVKKHYDKDIWFFKYLTEFFDISLDEVLEFYSDKNYNLYGLISTSFYTHPGFSPEIVQKYINKNPNKWSYYKLSRNPIIATQEFIEKNIDKPWDFKYLSSIPTIATQEFIQKCIDKGQWNWDFHCLSRNPMVATQEFIEKKIDKSFLNTWDFKYLSSIPNVATWDFVKKYRSRDWDYPNLQYSFETESSANMDYVFK